MHISRRALIGFGCALALPCGAARAAVPDQYAALMRRVMGLKWAGKARISADWTDSGYLVSSIAMEFRLASDWTFSGDLGEVVKIDGQAYCGYSTIWGHCWVADDHAGLSITRMRNDSGDALPGNVGWGTSTGHFRFANDTDRPGHFALEGVMRDDRSNEPAEVLMTDI